MHPAEFVKATLLEKDRPYEFAAKKIHDLRADAVAMGDRDGNFCCHKESFSV